MFETKVILVLLRQPRKKDRDEKRSDPFWEFGSFGCTACHSKNLLYPRNADLVKGSQLAFSQGGPQGFKLVHLTPPISVVAYGDRCEAKWVPAVMPFRYDCAPLLIDNEGNTDAPSLKKIITYVKRNTWCGKLSSKFRSRVKPLDDDIAKEIRKIYHDMSRKAIVQAKHYVEALPYPPSIIDEDRKTTYQSFISKLKARTRVS